MTQVSHSPPSEKNWIDVTHAESVKKLYLLNTGTARNLGDRAMLVNCLRIIRKEHPSLPIVVPGDVPEWICREFGLAHAPTLQNCLGRWSNISRKLRLPSALAALLSPIYYFLAGISITLLTFAPEKILAKAACMETKLAGNLRSGDLFWCTGGGYLTDLGKLDCRAILFTVYLAALHRSKIIMSGQGIGPLSTSLSRLLAKAAFQRADRIICREGAETPRLLSRLKIQESRIQIGVDDACSLPVTEGTDGTSESIAIHYRSSRFHEGPSGLEAAILKALTIFVNRGIRIKLFVFHEDERGEENIYKRWAKELETHRDHVRIIKEKDPRKLRRELANCSGAIGMAYHFCLFSVLSLVPTLALYEGEYYAAKFNGIAALSPDLLSLNTFGETDEMTLCKWHEANFRATNVPESSRMEGIEKRSGEQFQFVNCWIAKNQATLYR